MQRLQGECLHGLQAARNEEEVFGVTSTMARQLGFDYCAFGLRTPFPLSRPKFFTISNYSPAWQERYQAAGYLRTDPTVLHGATSSAPLVWTDRVFANARDLWEDAHAHGLRHGWAQSCHDPQGMSSLLTLAREDDEIAPGELAAKMAAMSWLVQATHSRMAQLATPRLMPDAGVLLTAREIEVMRWTADGKTSADISAIMTISENTVNFHIKNAVFKLNATNKTAGVVKAAMMGLLD